MLTYSLNRVTVIQVQAIVDHHHNVDVKVATKVRFQEPGNQSPNLTDDTKLMHETELNNKEVDTAEEVDEKEEAKENNDEETKLIGGSPKVENKENTEKEAEEVKETKEAENDAQENKSLSPEIKKPTITP